MNNNIKLRNTTTVPKGQVAHIVNPDGTIKKIHAGSFISPKDLNKVHLRPAGPSEGQQSSGEGNHQPRWEEVAEMIKRTPLEGALLNTASFNLKQYLPFQIKYSSGKVTPQTRFGAEFAIANLTNSVPGLKQLTAEINLTISIMSEHDSPLAKENVLGKDFIKAGSITPQNNEVVFYEHKHDVPELIAEVSSFLTHRIGYLCITHLMETLRVSEKALKDMEGKLKKTQDILQNTVDYYVKMHNGKTPKPGQDRNIDDLMQTSQELQKSLEDSQIMAGILTDMLEATEKEGFALPYLDTLEDGREAATISYGHIIGEASTYSLGINKTFQNGLERAASKLPQSVFALKNLFDFLTMRVQDVQTETN